MLQNPKVPGVQPIKATRNCLQKPCLS